MALQPSLTQSIVQKLGVEIVSGTYTSDKPFPIESMLCEKYRTSRTVVREAVKMLTAKGLLSARPRRGTIVEPEENWSLMDPDILRWLLERRFSLDILSEFTEVRYSIEPMAAYLATQKADTDCIAVIEESLKRMQDAEKGLDDPLQSDSAFHLSILSASKNRFYLQFRGLIESALTISIRFTNRFKGVSFADVDEHKKVYDAIVKGDADGAKSAMEHIISEAQVLIKAAMEQSASASSENDANSS